MTTATDDLKLRLRRMVDDTGTAIWSDANLLTTLHSHRRRIWRDPMEVEESYTGAGTTVYKIFHSHYDNYEAYAAGAADLYQIEDSAGAQRTIGTTDASPDYESGIVTMVTDQEGTALYVSGWSYDLNGAAMDCWQERMAKVSLDYDVNLDGHGLSRSQKIKQCEIMVEKYASRSWPVIVKAFNQGGNY